jgi:hypothetical protein
MQRIPLRYADLSSNSDSALQNEGTLAEREFLVQDISAHPLEYRSTEHALTLSCSIAIQLRGEADSLVINMEVDVDIRKKKVVSLRMNNQTGNKWWESQLPSGLQFQSRQAMRSAGTWGYGHEILRPHIYNPEISRDEHIWYLVAPSERYPLCALHLTETPNTQWMLQWRYAISTPPNTSRTFHCTIQIAEYAQQAEYCLVVSRGLEGPARLAEKEQHAHGQGTNARQSAKQSPVSEIIRYAIPSLSQDIHYLYS